MVDPETQLKLKVCVFVASESVIVNVVAGVSERVTVREVKASVTHWESPIEIEEIVISFEAAVPPLFLVTVIPVGKNSLHSSI